MQRDPQTRQRPAGTGRKIEKQNQHANDTRSAVQTSSRPIDLLLPRLEGVQRSGKGWRAFCPACGGKSRKLAISECDDGTVLLHCFSCNDTPGILVAIGTSVADLFPHRPRDDTPEGRREAHRLVRQAGWAAALDVLAHEATVVEVAAAMILRGDTLTAEDMERIRTASQWIHDTREALRP